MKILENISLKKYNTFGIDAVAKRMIILEQEQELLEIKDLLNNDKYVILGGGSNVLLTGDFDGTVIYVDIKGITILKSDSESHFIEVKAGEEWHDFVDYTVKNKFYGFENLAYIPGKCGAAPVQNIGAYGIEQNKYFLGLKGLDIENNQIVTFRNDECNFGYRDSVFKHQYKNNFIISSIIYKLDAKFDPVLSYKDLAEKFNGIEPSQKDIFEAVIEIRKNKLPEPEVLGNSGSFFKNPVISKRQYKDVKLKHPEIRGRETDNGSVKLSAAQLIELAGKKGIAYKDTDAAVYDKHSLILVNKGNASGQDIYELSEEIIRDVKNSFGILLEREVNLI